MWMELEPEEYGYELQREVRKMIESTPLKNQSGVIAKLIIEMMHSVATTHCSTDISYEFESNGGDVVGITADEFYMRAYGKVKNEY
jgi:hypothetical protein